MSKDIEEQMQLAREILLFAEQNGSDNLMKLKLLNTNESPSLAVLISVMNDMTNEVKASLTEHCLKTTFAKSVIDVVVKYEIINTKAAGWNSYRNNLLRLSFLFQKYFGVKKLEDFSHEHWSVVVHALVGQHLVWRLTSVFSTQNAIRTFVKAFNETHRDNTITFRAFGERSRTSGRALRQTKLQYIATLGENFSTWMSLFSEWKESLVLKNAKQLSASLTLFVEFLQENNLDLTPFEFLLLRKKPCFWSYLKRKFNSKENKSIRPHALKMYEFNEWIIKEKMSEQEDGELITLATSLLALDVYHHVSNFTIASVRGKAENVKAILPVKYLNLIREILVENDHAWPRSQGWLYKKLANHQSGQLEDVWHPHLTYLFLFMLEVPVRKMQVLCLDSGEGDDSRWIGGKWLKNDSKPAGYWSKNFGDNRGRGVTRKAYNSEKETTAIYINTNKTQDIGKGFGAASGYTINWHNEAVIEIVDYMRDWQEKYNPVAGPVAYKDLPSNTFSDSPTDTVLEMIPDRFYLFRYTLNQQQSTNYNAAPPADYLTFRFWHLLMKELECRLNKMGEDVVITTGWTGNIPSKSIFTPHSLRGSGLTALAEAGVPIEVLSKVVAGHASILMTLGYIKYNNAYVSHILSEARLKIEQSEQENYTTYLKSATWDDAFKYAVFNEELEADDWEASKTAHLFENRQIGICPNSGTRCSEGGEVIRKNGAKSLYGPVVGGNGNCVRCRFFMTGLAFLVPLWLKANKDLSDARAISIEVENESAELEKLRTKRFNIVKEKGVQQIPPSLQVEIKQAEARLDAKSARLDEMLSNAHATYRLVEKVKALSGDNKSSYPALINEDTDSADAIEFTDVSQFRQKDFLVQASRLYPHVKDEKLEMERNHFIDQIMFNMGMAPITLSNLTESEKKSACDAAGNYLNSKLSDYEMQLIESGQVEIQNLGIGKNEAHELNVAVNSELKLIALKELE